MLRLMLRIGAILLVMIGFLTGDPWTSEGQALANKPASPEVLSVVRIALRDRLIAGDIPDIGVAREAASVRLYVRADLPGSKLMLTSDALPDAPGVHLELITVAEARELAERTRQHVRFVTVDHVQIGADSATLWLGADFVAPEQPGIIKMCCCEGEARFVKRNGVWKFDKWTGPMRCA